MRRRLADDKLNFGGIVTAIYPSAFILWVTKASVTDLSRESRISRIRATLPNSAEPQYIIDQLKSFTF